MNKIIFDKYIEENDKSTDQLYPSNLTLSKNEEEEKEAPYYGMQPLERHKGAKFIWMYNAKEVFVEEPKDFTETFKDFCFSSLYIKEEVIQAL